MEKTGAERVKYSLACQHEDAIPIKFVSYAQKCPTVLYTFAVALRKESVDRNALSLLIYRQKYGVALRKESVDRNSTGPASLTACTMSLSARRAWIEIADVYYQANAVDVALRKESVDRNRRSALALSLASLSLSARRAWIEMPKL